MEILKISISSSILILVIAIIRALVLHKLPKRTFLVLWCIALCRLLVPVSIPSRFSVYTLVDILKNSYAKTANVSIALPNTYALPNTWVAHARVHPILADTTGASVSPFMLIWIFGLLVCVLFFLITHFRCRMEYKTALPIDNELVREWLYEHPIKRKVEIRQSDKISAPLTYGIFRPVVLLPKATEWTNETRLRYILTHEFIHIQRFDIILKWLLASVLCVYWFNPFVWMMYVLANRDIELSCDETVVLTFGETMKSAYALALIGLEEKKSRLSPLVNHFSKNAIEERIVAIMKIKKISLAGFVLSLMLVIVTTTAFATSAPAITEDISGLKTISLEYITVSESDFLTESDFLPDIIKNQISKVMDKIFFDKDRSSGNSLIVKEPDELNDYTCFNVILPKYLPEGYVFERAEFHRSGNEIVKNAKYANLYFVNGKTGKYLSMRQSFACEETVSSLSTDGKIDKIEINGMAAVLIKDRNIYWEFDGVIYSLYGIGEVKRDELIKIAESVN